MQLCVLHGLALKVEARCNCVCVDWTSAQMETGCNIRLRGLVLVAETRCSGVSCHDSYYNNVAAQLTSNIVCSMTVGAGLTSTQWAQSAYTIAKARHREVTSKGMSDANKLSLEQRLHGLTRHFSMASNSGQAAVMVIDLCAEFAYECLAIGYDMRSNSDTLSTMITQ